MFSGIVAWFITQLIFRFLNRHRAKVPFFGWLLDFDIRDVLPFLPRREKKAASAPSRKKASAADEDVKTYPAKRRAPAAEAPAEGVQPAPARPAAKKENTAPAHAAAEPAKAAPARSGGRHALPEGSKSSRPKASGTYQGKH